ncbi:MAG: hypothetical protein LUH56_07175 [Oscillospiraceae bacterium]|nr:hypothetical protein [Oscillospiraceae bacterium]
MEKDKLIEIAAGILNISPENANKYSQAVPEIDGMFFWNPVRGGLQVLIGATGEKLAANSSLSFEQILTAFQKGKRN